MKFIVLIALFSLITTNAQQKWEKLKGPVGGVIAGLIAKGDTIIAGTGFDHGLIYFSTDRGNSWSEANVKVFRRFGGFTFSQDGAVLAAGHENGIYKSFDLINWTNIYNPGLIIWSLGTDHTGKIYAGTDEGIMKSSSDNGLTWIDEITTLGRINKFELTKNGIFYAGALKRILKKTSAGWDIFYLDSLGSQLIGVNSDNDGFLYANTNHSIYKSTNEGLSWIKLDPDSFFIGGEYIYNIIINKNVIVGLSDETSFFGDLWGIALSIDDGYTWQLSNNGLPPKMQACSRFAKSGSDTYLGTNAAGVFKSTDFGVSWSGINTGLNAAEVLDFVWDNQGNLYAACWSNGIQKSTDRGLSWFTVNNGLTNVYLYSIIIDQNGIILAGTDQGLFRSTNNGELWTQTNQAGNNYSFYLYKDNRNRIYSVNYGNGIHRTTDAGNSWVRLDNNFITSYVFGFSIDSSGNIFAGTRYGAIYRSSNDGVNWTKVYQSPLINSVVGYISTSPDGNIYASNIREGVLRSTDGGLNWAIIKPDAGNQWSFPIAVNSKGEVFTTGTNDKIFYSTDRGENWIDISDNIYLTTVHRIKFDNLNNVYLGTDESMWYWDRNIPVELISFSGSVTNNDITLSWETASEKNNKGFEVQRKDIEWHILDFLDGKGTTSEKTSYSFTDKNLEAGNHTYRLKQIDYDGTFKYSNELDVSVPLQYEFALNQNYPNPFNPSTKISYTLKDEGNVKLLIYDIKGELISTLVNDKRQAGSYEVDFTLPGNISTGVYIYRLTVSDNNGRQVFSDVKKMIYLK